MLCINTGEEQFISRTYKSPLDVPPLTEPGITCGCCKRGGNNDNTYQVVDTPRPSTLGMIAARGMEQVSCKSVSAPYLQHQVNHTPPSHLPAGLLNSNAKQLSCVVPAGGYVVEDMCSAVVNLALRGTSVIDRLRAT
eukprot:scaffold115967_cov84-Cyclotella_meneghiniana.AAC.1